MKYKVRYFTEFGSRETILEESELVIFIYRFKVSSIKALIIDGVSKSVNCDCSIPITTMELKHRCVKCNKPIKWD